MSQKFKKKIGWQKYETLLEEQLSSNFLLNLLNKHKLSVEDVEEYEGGIIDDMDEEESAAETFMIPITSKLIEEANIIQNFDCWIGHTNFDITQDIKDSLDTIQGVELMNIMSRYRFFIGIGRMFEFKNVRRLIENTLIKENFENDNNEHKQEN